MSLRLIWFAAAILLVAGSTVPEGIAQERRLPSSASELRLSYAPVVERAAPAVVNVYAAKTVAIRNPLFDDFRRFFGRRNQISCAGLWRSDLRFDRLGKDLDGRRRANH